MHNKIITFQGDSYSNEFHLNKLNDKLKLELNDSKLVIINVANIYIINVNSSKYCDVKQIERLLKAKNNKKRK